MATPSVSPTKQNEVSVMLMQSGDNKKAIKTLLMTLHALRQEIIPPPVVRSGLPSAPALGIMIPRKNGILRCTSMSDIEATPAKGQMVFEKVPLYAVSKSETLLPVDMYRNAFLIPENEEVSKRCKSAIILYNCGLASHRLAILEGSSVRYEEALYLYREAHAEVVGIHLMQSPAYIVLVAGIFYNMSIIHTDFFHRDEARFLRKKLVAFFCWEGSLLMETSDYIFFHVNLYLGISEDFRIAPCA